MPHSASVSKTVAKIVEEIFSTTDRSYCPEWPREYGGSGLSGGELVQLAAALGAAGVDWPSQGNGEWFVGPIIMRYGTEEQRRRILPRIKNGTDRYCIALSEVSAGTDLSLVHARFEVSGLSVVCFGEKTLIQIPEQSTHIVILAYDDRGEQSLVSLPLDQEGIQIHDMVDMGDRNELYRVIFDGALGSLVDVFGDRGKGKEIAAFGRKQLPWRESIEQIGRRRRDMDNVAVMARKYGADESEQFRTSLAETWIATEILEEYVAMKYGGPDVLGEPDASSSCMGLLNNRWFESFARLQQTLFEALNSVGVDDRAMVEIQAAAMMDAFIDYQRSALEVITEEGLRDTIGDSLFS